MAPTNEEGPIVDHADELLAAIREQAAAELAALTPTDDDTVAADDEGES